MVNRSRTVLIAGATVILGAIFPVDLEVFVHFAITIIVLEVTLLNARLRRGADPAFGPQADAAAGTLANTVHFVFAGLSLWQILIEGAVAIVVLTVADLLHGLTRRAIHPTHLGVT
jgi:hypothetical protein